MPIREFFHLMQIVDDFDDTETRYQTLLSPQVFMAKSWSNFDKRWASLSAVGPDLVLEMMEPSKLDEDQQSPLPKFHRRHGQHLHSLSWYVDTDDVVPLIERMRRYGIRVDHALRQHRGRSPGPAHSHLLHPPAGYVRPTGVSGLLAALRP